MTIDSDIALHGEIGKITIGQDEVYATGYVMDYEYIKNHYRLITKSNLANRACWRTKN